MSSYQCLSAATCTDFIRRGIVCRVCKESTDANSRRILDNALLSARRLLESNGYTVILPKSEPFNG